MREYCVMFSKCVKIIAIYTLIILVTSLKGTFAQYSEGELEQFLLDIINNNATDEIVSGNFSENACDPRTVVKPNFKDLYHPISEAKCQEYIWEMQNREEEEKQNDQCRLFLINEIKQGRVPNFFFALNIHDIFGGRTAKVGEFPHMGALGWPAKDPAKDWIFKCGSSLISYKFLVTAAHCSKLSERNTDVLRFKPEVVVLGTEDIKDNESNNVRGALPIKQIIVHPEYRSPKKYNDIALIELEQPLLAFGSNMQPACISRIADRHIVGKEAALSGWGKTETGGSPTKLQTANVDIIESRTCNHILNRYRNRNWRGFAQSQMCAGKLAGGTDACQGDSGGPLQIQIPLNTTGKMYHVLGITSFGVKCAKRNRPGIYTRISTYVDWIEKIVWGDGEDELAKFRKGLTLIKPDLLSQ